MACILCNMFRANLDAYSAHFLFLAISFLLGHSPMTLLLHDCICYVIQLLYKEMIGAVLVYVQHCWRMFHYKLSCRRHHSPLILPVAIRSGSSELYFIDCLSMPPIATVCSGKLSCCGTAPFAYPEMPHHREPRPELNSSAKLLCMMMFATCTV